MKEHEYIHKVEKILKKIDISPLQIPLEEEVVRDILKGYEFGRFEKFKFENLSADLFIHDENQKSKKYVPDEKEYLKKNLNNIEKKLKDGEHEFTNLFSDVYHSDFYKTFPENIKKQAGDCYGSILFPTFSIISNLHSHLFDENKEQKRRYITDTTKDKVVVFYNDLCNIITSPNAEKEIIANVEKLIKDYAKKMKINYLKSTRQFLDGMFEYLSSKK